MQPAEGNVGVAFALVIGAGLSTTLGATAAFYAKLASPLTLAVGLGLSAGVMLCAPLSVVLSQELLLCCE
jgi:zinc transporter, ZIP family